jgi:type II secretory pathway predicted ATPase ExeA
LRDTLARSPGIERLILDEAHRLPDRSLEELRLLGQLDFDRRAPLALILAGQLLLRERWPQLDFEALGPRLIVRTVLSPLTDGESADYRDRRPRAVGVRSMLFRPGAVDLLFQPSRGVRRRLNPLALSARLAAARAGRRHVEASDVPTAVVDEEQA